MAKYSVTLEYTVPHQATYLIEADNEVEAGAMAMAREAAGIGTWEECSCATSDTEILNIEKIND